MLFPGHNEPGGDLILPDIRHIEDRLEGRRALVLTMRMRTTSGPFRSC
ncbi:ribonuclease family protein [Mycobacteroides abscessus]|nr:ribonuclease family protein [Mycobacteroides abscessus]